MGTKPVSGSAGIRTCFKKQMEMVGNKRPCKTTGICFLKDCTEPVQKIAVVGVILKNYATLYPTGNDMM